MNIGLPEMLIVLVVALLIFGARLPKVARSIGRAKIEFQQGIDEAKNEGKPGNSPS